MIQSMRAVARLSVLLAIYWSVLPASTAGDIREEQDVPQFPLAFEKNLGQSNMRVNFSARGLGYNLFLTGPGAVLVFDKTKKKQVAQDDAVIPSTRLEAYSMSMELEGGNKLATVAGSAPLSYVTSYFLGSESNQQMRDVQSFARVSYSSVYPGIDLEYYGNQGQLEYDFKLKPYADASKIAIRFGGISSASISEDGALLLKSDGGDLVFRRPIAYQEDESGRVAVTSRYLVKDDGAIGFALGKYDSSKELVIDPILSYASLLWGSNAKGVAVDAAGNTFIAGYTPVNDLPTNTGYQSTLQGYLSGYIVKLNPAGTQVLAATYLGAKSAHTWLTGIALDASGNPVVTGFSDSTSFPITNGAYQTRANSADYKHAFITKLNSTINALTFSTNLGSASELNGVAVDSNGNVFVIGTASALATTTGTYQTTTTGHTSAPFVVKLNSIGTGVGYVTYLDYSMQVRGIALDSAGNAYIAGRATVIDFPVTNPIQNFVPVHGGAFVFKLNTTGSAAVYKAFMGGNGSGDIANAIAVDKFGQAHIVGATDSDDFPVTNGVFQPVKGSQGPQSYNAFVAKLNSAGNGLIFASYLGGAGSYYTGVFGAQYSDRDIATAIGLDGAGYIYVGGLADTPSFPSVDPILASGTGRLATPFVAKINPIGDKLIYSTPVARYSPGCPTCLWGGGSRSLNSLVVSATGVATAVGSLIELQDADPSLMNTLVFNYSNFNTSAGAVLTTSGNAFISRIMTGKFPTTVRVPANPILSGIPVTLKADVQSAVLNGTVTFFDGTISLGTVAPINGIAAVPASFTVGAHRITAVYSGDNKVSPIMLLDVKAE